MSTAIQDPAAPIEAEEDDYDTASDRDSAFGTSIGESSTASLGSSILKYREENGRTYHAYKEGKYALPNDESEKDRLDLQHHLYSLTYKGKLHLCEIPKDRTVHRVLDVGTGTGIWAIDYADEHPEAHVQGIDLSPIQPSFIPPNLSFEIDDLEEPWTFSHAFDLIHARMMTGSIASWPSFFAQAYTSLSPGGFIEISDLTFPVRTDDGSFPPDSALEKWGGFLAEASRNLGRAMDSAELYREQLEQQGFVDVRETRFKWPMNRWPRDKEMKELGAWNYENMAPDCAGLSMAFFTRGLGWTAQEVEVFSMKVKKEMRDTKIHAYIPIYTVWGRKPA